MANTAQARKRAKQNLKRAANNITQRSRMRTLVKKIRKLVDAGDQEGARKLFPEASTYIDKVAGRHLIHANKAARLKSRLNALLK